jgi:hypothetical protein
VTLCVLAGSSEQVLGQQEDAEDDHRAPGEPRDDARDGRTAVQDPAGNRTHAEVEGRAGEHEDQAEDCELHGQRPVPARGGELR